VSARSCAGSNRRKGSRSARFAKVAMDAREDILMYIEKELEGK